MITVHVDSAVLSGSRKDGLSELEDGTPIAPETVRRLACDASVVRIVEDADGMPLDVGRRTRTIPPALRRALEARDRGCRFPGCTNHLFVDAHHVHHWAAGGETSLKNVLSMCSRHHALVHEGGYRIEVREGGAITFHAPSGKKLESAPSLPELTPEMLAALEEEHGIAKHELCGDHLRPINYTPMNLDYAVSSLLAARALRYEADHRAI